MMVRRAESKQDLEAVARLMRAFIAWHYERHAADRAIIDSYFDPVKFDAELAALPGEFAPPGGDLLVAEHHGIIGGCVALRPFGNDACEMKRMFVLPRFQGRGAGRLLATAIVARASDIGYRRMLLDTGPAQHEAQGLYRKLGFRPVEPYYSLSPRLRDWLVFMELDLAPQASPRPR